MSPIKSNTTIGKLKGLISKGDQAKPLDEGAVEDLNELGNNLTAANEGNPRWQAYINPYKLMFNEEVLATEIEKTSEMIGFNKKAEDFLKTNVDAQCIKIPDIELKGKLVKLKEVGESIARRVSKLTFYWSKGNKKNSLFIACMVSPV